MLMLSLFPQILWLAPLGTALLRISVGLVFLLIGLDHWRRRGELSKADFILVGHGMWIPMLAALIELAVALCLFLGAYTQVAAIFGALLALKQLVWHGSYPSFFPFSRSTSALLLAICLSLIVSGAGAFALDLPL
jgi:uncharacterized membrane protein YphA (DoxX/SURF4 family)